MGMHNKSILLAVITWAAEIQIQMHPLSIYSMSKRISRYDIVIRGRNVLDNHSIHRRHVTLGRASITTHPIIGIVLHESLRLVSRP